MNAGIDSMNYNTITFLIVFHLQAKAEIRRLLPGGLQESISKVRSSVVSVMFSQILAMSNISQAGPCSSSI